MWQPRKRNKQPAACIIRHSYYPDGHVRRDAETLVAAGYDVSVVALRRPGQERRETLNGVEIYRLPVTHRRGTVVRYAWEYLAFASLAFLTVALLHLRKRFRVVEVDNMPDILVFSALVPKLTGAPVILYIFDNMPELLTHIWKTSPRHPLVRALGLLERVSAGFADRVIVTQEMARQAVIGRGTHPAKVSVVLNCPDEAIFQPRVTTDRERQDGAFRIVTHGSILERYGIQVMLDALPQIATVIPNVEFHIFGEGEYRAALEARVRELAIQDCVHFHGLAPLEELLEHLASADVGYAGMLCDLMLSNKLMEYVAFQTPAAVARWPTFEHYFPEDAVTYFAPGDPDDLARAVIDIFRDRDGAQARATQALALYQRYRWPVQRERYLDVYRQLLQPRPRSTMLSRLPGGLTVPKRLVRSQRPGVSVDPSAPLRCAQDDRGRGDYAQDDRRRGGGVPDDREAHLATTAVEPGIHPSAEATREVVR